MARRDWVEREFRFHLPIENYQDALERLRGTPSRLEERTASLPREKAIQRDGGRWSPQENVGHLLDLEPLGMGRTQDILAGRDLRAADLSNEKTHRAGHNEVRLQDLLARFREARLAWVARLAELAAPDFARSGRHPRLGTPMRLLDLCQFVADHDDHHLARIGALVDGEREASNA